MKKIDLRSVALTLATLAVLGLIGAGAVVGLGLYNVSARAGHLPGVSWVLHTTFRNSVDLRAPAASAVPDLTPEMAALGAKHFDTACRICHAAPGQERTATIRAMVPAPPHITEAVGTWSAAELHWIVDEGVKMSGMPHWPAQRTDDVWPVVAFLLDVQDGMTAQAYAAMTAIPDGEPNALAACTTCHGGAGVSGNPHIPRLDILSEAYIAGALQAYRSGDRDSGIMHHAASEAAPQVLQNAARTWGATAPGAATETDIDDDLAARGELIATEGVEGSDVPACAACHGPWPERIDPAYPSLSGQYRPYLESQLRLWRAGARGGTRVADLMHRAAKRLSDADIAAVAAWYASRPPAKLNAAAP